MTGSTSPLVSVNASCLRHSLRGKRVCVGLSGGLDSVALLDVMLQMRGLHDLEISAVHVNHGLSANAARWAAFCQSLCDAHRVPLSVVNVKVDLALPGGVESIAREARYDAFRQVDADCLAVAQHADDQAETVLHHLLRGTGLKGMAGMGEVRLLRSGLQLFRPFLNTTRDAIEAYAIDRKLDWIEDESNTDTAHTRNFIRHDLAPIVSGRFPHYRESLARAGRHAAEADEMLSALAAIDLKWDGRNAHADVLDGLSPARQVNALYHWLQWLRWTDCTKMSLPSQDQLADWAQQLFRPSPSDRPHQAGGHDFVIKRRRNLLLLERK